VELVLPEVKSYVFRSWDKVMYSLAETRERRRLHYVPHQEIQSRETSLNETKR
jgi:hypothetical protein